MPVETIVIEASHPVFAGHFPGRPIVPGAMLLDRAQRLIEAAMGQGLTGLAQAKFLSISEPGEILTLDYEAAGHAVRFTIRGGARIVASGRFAVQQGVAA